MSTKKAGKLQSALNAVPNGYLVGCHVVKPQAGELHLERSFFGRLSGMAA